MSGRADIAEIYRATDGWRFRIKAGNGEVILQGEQYENLADARALIESRFPHTPIVELDADERAPTDG